MLFSCLLISLVAVSVAVVSSVPFDVSKVTCIKSNGLWALLIVWTNCSNVSALTGVSIAKSGGSSSSSFVSVPLVGSIESLSDANQSLSVVLYFRSQLLGGSGGAVFGWFQDIVLLLVK